MSTELENLKAELAALAGRIAALETAQQPEAEWPKDGDTYFFIDGDGDVVDSLWSSDRFDDSRMNIGSVYRTVTEAEHEIDRRKVLTELRKLAKASGKRDWADKNQTKYRLVYEADAMRWAHRGNQIERTQGAVYFATEESAQAAIETIGADRLMLLLED